MRSVLRLRPMLLKIPASKCCLLSTSSTVFVEKVELPKTKALVSVETSQDSAYTGHYERNFITAMRAMQDFLLKPEDLVGLRVTTRRSPNDTEPPLKVYWRKDVEAKSAQVWGSQEALEKERERLQAQAEEQKELVSFYKRLLSFKAKKSKKKLGRENWPVRAVRRTQVNQGLESDSGKVVMTAIGINSANCIAKGIAWVFTGSHAMFSEMIHSAADTMNQVILAYGIKKSTKIPNNVHPYGYSQMQYVSSLISAVGIFFMGSGLSIYHGLSGLNHPHELESMNLAIAVLTGSFISEAVTLALAIKSIRQSAKEKEMGFLEYVAGGYDPCVNVVLLEDFAAVLGVVIAGGSMGLSLHLHSHIPDAVGSIMIGGLLGTVASFMIYTNSTALVGRSIPEEKIKEINEGLEGDIMVRQIMDVKGIDMGNGIVRYKAEVDVDGRELARYYLSQRDLNAMMAEIKAIDTTDDLERFMLKHGENIVDCLGEQVDRIEKELKSQHPELRHVDLEVL